MSKENQVTMVEWDGVNSEGETVRGVDLHISGRCEEAMGLYEEEAREVYRLLSSLIEKWDATELMHSLKSRWPGYTEYFLAKKDNEICLVGAGNYSHHSVLAGQWHEVQLEWYPSVEAAEAATGLKVGDYQPCPPASVPSYYEDELDLGGEE